MTTPATTHAPLRVAYLVKTWPRLSETFVLNEILALEARGAIVTILALKRPAERRFHEKLARVRGDVLYAPEVRSNQVLSFLASQHKQLAGAETLLSRHFWTSLDQADDEGLESLIPAIAFLPVVVERQIDHLHAHFATSAAATAMRLASLAGVGWSMTAHAKDIFHQSVSRDRLRDKVASSRFTVAVSDWSAEFLRDVVGHAAASNVRRLYNGLDLTEFPTPRFGGAGTETAAILPELPVTPARILSVGRLVPKKGFGTLLLAARRLIDQGHDIHVDLVGDGELRSELERSIRELGLGERVHLLGAESHDAVRQLMRSSTLFALPAEVAEDGNRDGLPVVVVEAMASGLPVVSTPVVGIPEAVLDGITGRLVPEKDPIALADAIAEMLADRAGAARLAEAGRRRVDEHFDGARSAATLHEWFQGAVRLEAAKPESMMEAVGR